MSSYFSTGYREARARFLELAQDGRIEHFAVASATERDLFTDFAYFEPRREHRTLFVLVSGVHGLEAYAGSAIQSMFLKEILPHLDRSSAGFLLVHCMNPFGFKRHRRNTENQVNLNRNCSAGAQLYKMKNERSLLLSERFVPKKPVTSLTSHLVEQMRREGSKVFFGDVEMDDFVKSVGAGQYTSAAGLEFGGFHAEPQVARFTQHLKEIMPAYKDIVLLDLHTGLGESGRLHLLSDDMPGSINPELFAELFNGKADQALYEFTPGDAEGFYPTYGALNGLFPELARADQRVCALTMEFGTMGHDLNAQLDGLNRWMLEHQGFLYGYAAKDLEIEVTRKYLERFYPSDDEWKRNVLSLSKGTFARVFERAGIHYQGVQ